LSVISVNPTRSEKQTVSFLRLLTILTSCCPVKDRVVDLLPLLELGDVGIDRDRAAVLGAPLADHHPAPIAAPLHLRLARIAVMAQAVGDPLLQAAFRVLDISALGCAPDDALEGCSDAQVDVQAGIQQVAIA
jgi:hypothetical protein